MTERLIDANKLTATEAVIGEKVVWVVPYKDIYEASTVDAEPVRHGKWKQWDVYELEDTYECTACGESFVLIEGTPITNGYKYCPWCGAKMDEERKEE